MDDPTQTRFMSRTQRLSLGAVLLATLFTFASTFTFGWVYDDPPQIPQNQNLQWSRLGFLFTHQLWASMSGLPGRFYRPLLSLWFLINKTVFSLNPHGFHVTSVLAHGTATALAFFIARRLLKNAGLRNTESALFAAAIFGLHPLQAESASWISSANDPLAAALCFASFLTYRKATATRQSTTQQSTAGWWALSALLFLCALLTKEVSVVLPGIILIDLWSDSLGQPRSIPSRRFLLTAISTYGLVGILWLSLRAWALRGTASTSSLASFQSPCSNLRRARYASI